MQPDDDKTQAVTVLAKGTVINHYRIVEKIGSGGMGEVYLAEDTELNRKVALKFLSTHLCQDADCRARFKREAQAAAKLNHPNIVTIYEVSEFSGRPFFAMENVEGQTLREHGKGKELPLSRIIELAIQICEGLAKAHSAGVVHRDIKPSNILIDQDGRAKIVDFGLASVHGSEHLTKTGSTLGTVGYMSPEQARGEEVDSRSDLFSFGVVLYELIAGRSPFKAEFDAATIRNIIEAVPEPLARYKTDVSDELQRVVSKALAKDRSLRYQHADDLQSDLKGCLLTDNKRQKTQEKSIVVLPFENLSADPDQEYFSDGLTDEVISDLAGIKSLRVISRSSAMTFKGTKKKVPDIAREVNVRYVLEGSVRKAGSSLRITAQLIDATSDAHIWSEKYSGTLDDVFDIQERVSRSIVAALKLKLTTGESSKLAERPFENVVAYDYWLKAQQEIWRFAKDSLDRALRYLDEAMEITGDNATIYATRAEAYFQHVNMGIKQDEYIVKAEECIEKAFAADPNSAKAHAILGWLIISFRGNVQDAIHHLKKALAINPDETAALNILSAALGFVGKKSEAIKYSEMVQQIDPLGDQTNLIRGIVRLYSGEYGASLDLFRDYYQLGPNNPVAQFYYAWALVYNNRIDEANAVIEQAVQGESENLMTNLCLLLKYSLLKDTGSAFAVLTPGIRTTCRRDLEYSHTVACLLAKLDAKSEALDWLEHSVDRGFINYPLLTEIDPFLANIRGEDRFKKLAERVKYEWEHFEV